MSYHPKSTHFLSKKDPLLIIPKGLTPNNPKYAHFLSSQKGSLLIIPKGPTSYHPKRAHISQTGPPIIPKMSTLCPKGSTSYHSQRSHFLSIQVPLLISKRSNFLSQKSPLIPKGPTSYSKRIHLSQKGPLLINHIWSISYHPKESKNKKITYFRYVFYQS